MQENLGLDEIDALLSAAGAGSLPTGPHGAAKGKAKRYERHDFKLAGSGAGELLAALKSIHEAFARELGASLSGYLRAAVDIKLIAVEQTTCGEFIASVPNPTSLGLLSVSPLAGQIALEINPSVIFPFIDRLLGGGVRESEPPDRPMTEIEQGLVATVITRIAEQLKAAWKGVGEIDFKVAETGSDPQLVAVIAPNETVILLRFEVTLGNLLGTISLGIPRRVIEPIAAELITRSSRTGEAENEGEGRDARVIASNLAKVGVECVCRLAESTITLGDLAGLRPGDVIQTAEPADGDVVLRIGGVSIFRGTPGRYKGKKGVLIKSAADHSKDDT